MDISGSVALVTGANRGLGRTIAETLVRRGARHVYGTSRRPVSPQEREGADDARFTSMRLDLGDECSVADVAALCNDVTLIVNNAGTLATGDMLACDMAAIRSELETNTLGLINAVRQFAPVLARNGGGVIVNVLSVSALATSPGLGVYAASKAASWAATQAMRTTLADQNIRMLAAFPGPIDTDMARGLEIPKASPQAVADALIDGIESEQAEIFPDTMARQVEQVWRTDPARLLRQFATL